MVDMVAQRRELRPLLARLCKLLTHARDEDNPEPAAA
jgi:acetyl-CoA carboxylase beta subunit